MIGRIWHGWTTPENADIYETLLETEIFPGIFAKEIDGLERIELFRRELGSEHDGEVEFATIMWFASLDAVKAFKGKDYATAYVPDAARKVLKRYDTESQHYEVRTQRKA